jgi:hypothetical protein
MGLAGFARWFFVFVFCLGQSTIAAAARPEFEAPCAQNFSKISAESDLSSLSEGTRFDDFKAFNESLSQPLSIEDISAFEWTYGMKFTRFIAKDKDVRRQAVREFYLRAQAHYDGFFHAPTEAERARLVLESKRERILSESAIRAGTISKTNDLHLYLGDPNVQVIMGRRNISFLKEGKVYHYVDNGRWNWLGPHVRGAFPDPASIAELDFDTESELQNIDRLFAEIPGLMFVPYGKIAILKDFAKTAITGDTFLLGHLGSEPFAIADLLEMNEDRFVKHDLDHVWDIRANRGGMTRKELARIRGIVNGVLDSPELARTHPFEQMEFSRVVFALAHEESGYLPSFTWNLAKIRKLLAQKPNWKSELYDNLIHYSTADYLGTLYSPGSAEIAREKLRTAIDWFDELFIRQTKGAGEIGK